MCERGVGKPLTPFLLLNISELSLSGESQIVAVAQTDLSKELLYPVRPADFVADNTSDDFAEITVRYLTPVILFRLRNKKNSQLSYQDKCNRFPSFYQLTRSAFFRLQKLYVLYNRTMGVPSVFEEILRETYLEEACRSVLLSADIRYVTLQNTQKKEKVNEMPLSGYVGEQCYSGNMKTYLPLLRFMKGLHVGNETVYGMGQYDVEPEKQLKLIH
jgi:hypothetical protein